jgi:hypothetical protein
MIFIAGSCSFAISEAWRYPDICYSEIWARSATVRARRMARVS